MRVLSLFFILSFGLLANTQPYKKEITFEPVSKPTLLAVKLDKEIYKHTKKDYASLRLMSASLEEGYFIAKEQVLNVVNNKRLKAISYERDKARLNYEFKEPFDVEELHLNIEDKNFESLVDVYVDGLLVSQGNKVFDYSNEVGTQNFRIKIAKIKAKKISLVYHIDQTTTFYKKYKNIRQKRQYLSIKSVNFVNKNRVEEHLDREHVKLLSFETKDKVSSYIFKVDNIPSEAILFQIKEKNFKRKIRVYASSDLEAFVFLKSSSISASSINASTNLQVVLKNRSRYLKVEVDNNDNKALNVKGLTILTKPEYLYFIAEENKQYHLYFGDQDLAKQHYELQSMLSKDEVYKTGKFSKAQALEVSTVVNDLSFLKKYKELLFVVLLLSVLLILSYIAFALLKRVE